jgi:hypothetical protein
MQKDERRDFTRVPFKSEVIVTTSSARMRGKIKDLSLKGALVKLTGEISVGEPAEIEIFLIEPASDLSVVLGGTAVRRSHEGIGIEFSGMYLDEYERLRDAVANSLGDKRLVVEEFIRYMGR